MLLRFHKVAIRENYETGNQAFSMRLRFLTIRPLAAGIVKDFYEALSNELEVQVDEPVYLSQGQLNAGDIVDPCAAQ
jgi:hypothetical protein